MIQASQLKFIRPTKQSRLLSVLFSIYEEPDGSQHKIAANTNLSSSMVNNYIKWLKQEGFVNVSGKTNRTQQYHLSDAGRIMLRKSLLDYSAEIVRLYGTVKEEISNILKGFYNEGIRTVVLFGVAETAEIVYAAAKRTPLVIIGVVDSDGSKQGRIFNGLEIRSPEDIREIRPDAVIITSFGRQEEIYRQVRAISGDKIKIRKLSDI
ncbi:MarR family transcriptional regulator [uncultured Desulfosarcina sp.]|uniref:MarR family transcriptional regulator n=1 Tax=uncultured Desulfosarcina sp. TaxID=218289 RepID=UPI0029C7202B|nr:MarR family transcriptional regulator [uncultured Desulfosarcina sp.]